MSGKGASKPSKVEGTKLASNYLRDPIAAEAASDAPSFSEEANGLLKFHGSYQQDDRDLRTQLRREGKDKAYQCMVRVRMPGGKIADARQYLACDELARTFGSGSLRITTRQEFQIHGVLKHDLASVLRRDQRGPSLDPGRLRRCRAERPGLRGSHQGRPPRPASERLRPHRLPLRPPDVFLHRYLARRREGRESALAQGRADPRADARG